jgi:hypothetical protein
MYLSFAKIVAFSFSSGEKGKKKNCPEKPTKNNLVLTKNKRNLGGKNQGPPSLPMLH